MCMHVCCIYVYVWCVCVGLCGIHLCGYVGRVWYVCVCVPLHSCVATAALRVCILGLSLRPLHLCQNADFPRLVPVSCA